MAANTWAYVGFTIMLDEANPKRLSKFRFYVNTAGHDTVQEFTDDGTYFD
jgi:hypothetical protein